MLSTELSERQLLDALPVKIFALDLDGHVTSVHSPAAKLADDVAAPTALPDVRGTLIWNALGGSISREQAEIGMRLLRTGHASVVRWELDRAPDDHRATLAQMTPIHDDAHAVTAFVISTIDITSLDRTREAIEESAVALARPIDVDHACHEASRQLRRVMRADCIVIALCGDDGPTPRIVLDYGTDDDRRTTEQRFASVWQSAIDTERLITSHSESAITLTIAIRGPSHPLGVMTAVADDDVASPERLGEGRRYFTAVAAQLGAAIERAHDVADAVRKRRGGAIGEVAAGVAHELRNPIFGISSAAQLLRFRAREDPVMEKNVGRILREVERLNRMVTTLLDIGRPIALKLSPADPDAVWDDVLESERGRLESRAIGIRRTKPNEGAILPIDGEQLAQVFKSILSNAVDAAPEATDITLQSTILPTGTWRCRLTNGGPPIPPEMLPRVFELFLSTKPGSTGVGLALAQRIVEEHHGNIAIDSAAETGTTVTVTLPNTPRTASVP